MAWTPTPEVQVARDAAKALTKSGCFVDRCVILYTTEQGQVGYASYGKDSAHCGQARRLADTLFEQAMETVGGLPAFHHRHGNRVSDGSGIDWKGLEEEVILKMRLLQTSVGTGMDAATRQMYVRDLVMPAVELLGRFCNCVNITTEAE